MLLHYFKGYNSCSGLESSISSKKSLLVIAKNKIKATDKIIKNIEQLWKHLQKKLRWSKKIKSE